MGKPKESLGFAQRLECVRFSAAFGSARGDGLARGYPVVEAKAPVNRAQSKRFAKFNGLEGLWPAGIPPPRSGLTVTHAQSSALVIG